MNATDLSQKLAPLSLKERELVITQNLRPSIRGVIRTLFLRSPVLPIVESDNA